MIDREKFLYGAKNKRVGLENYMYRRNCKLGASRQHQVYRNLSYTENRVLYSSVLLVFT